MPTGARVDEFLLPVATELPHDVAVLDDGRVLVTGMFTHQMWLLDPTLNQWDTEAIPVASANPRAIDITPRPGVEGAFDWWVLLGGPRQLARRDGLTGAWTSYPLGVYGHSVIPDAHGRVWFNSHFTRDPGIIGYVDGATGDVVTFDIPAPSHLADGGTPVPYGLRVAPDGSVWGTELRGNRIVRLDPQSGAVRTFDMPLPVSGPRRPDFDADGRFWIPEYAGNALTRFDPDTETFERYPLPVRDALPYVVRIDRTRGRIWIGTGAADAVFMFDPRTEEFTLYPLPSSGALIRHIDINDATGEVWLAYGASPGIPARIARLTPTD
jgi:streptogramin lyase